MKVGNNDFSVRSTEATNIGAGGLETTAVLLPHRRSWLLDVLTSIRTERALRFILPIPVLLYMSYTPVPVMIFGHLCIILYTIQAALLPPITTMVPIVFCCALPAIVIALAFLTTIWCLYIASANGHFSETQATCIVLVCSFGYFLLASNLRVGKLANIMTIAYYAMVYALEYAAVMSKYVMAKGIDAHLAPSSIRALLPPWIVNSLPSAVFDAIDYIPINLEKEISPGLLGQYASYRGMGRLIGVPVRIMGSIAAGVRATLPSGFYMVRFAWESEKEFGVINALMIWAFISYAAFCVTLFLPPWRTGTRLYTNAAAGCHAMIAANVIDWLSRSAEPAVTPPEATTIEEVKELQDTVAKTYKFTGATIKEAIGGNLGRRARHQTMLPQVRSQSSKILKDDRATKRRKSTGHLRFADDVPEGDKSGQPVDAAAAPQVDLLNEPAAEEPVEDFNPYYGYDVTRCQNAEHAKRFHENANIVGSLAKYPSYRARLELTQQTINTAQGPLLLSAFETAVIVGNQTNTNHNFGNDLPERLKIGPRLLEISVWLYIIQIQTTLQSILKDHSLKAAAPSETAERRDSFASERMSSVEVDDDDNTRRVLFASLGGAGEGFAEGDGGLAEIDADPSRNSASMISSNRSSAISVDGSARGSKAELPAQDSASQSAREEPPSGDDRRVTFNDNVTSVTPSRESRQYGSSASNLVSRRSSTDSMTSAGAQSQSAPKEENSEQLAKEVTESTPSSHRASDASEIKPAAEESETKPRVSVGSKFVDYLVRQRDQGLKSKVVPQDIRQRGRLASAVNFELPALKTDLINDILLSVYHALRLSETDENSKKSLNENYEERKVLVAYQKLCDLSTEANEQYPILPLYKNGLIASTIELLDLRRDSFIQLRTRSWKRTAISLATLLMGVPLFFYSLFIPWIQMITHFREDRKFTYSGGEQYVLLKEPVGDVTGVNLVVNAPASSCITEGAVTHLSVRVKGIFWDWRFNSALWFAIRLAIGNTFLLGLALALDAWRRLDIEKHSRRAPMMQFIDLERLLGTKYAAWACIGFITSITETAPATVKRAMLRMTGVVLGTMSAWALLSISRKSVAIHACWIMTTCFIAVWITAHPANPAIGFDPSWGYAAQLFTYQQVIIVALVAVQDWEPNEMVISRLAAQLLGIGTAVILSCTFFPTLPGRYIKHQCARAACHLQEHYSYLAGVYRQESDDNSEDIAAIHLRRATNAIGAARRSILDNDLFVEFKYLNLNPVHVELVSTMEHLLHIHTEWINRIGSAQPMRDPHLARLMEKLRLLLVLFASMIQSNEHELHHKCYAVLRNEVVDCFGSPEVIAQAHAWDQKYIARTFAPVELLQIDRLVQLVSTLSHPI